MVEIEDFKNNPELINKINSNVSELWSSFDNILALKNKPLCDDSVNLAFQNFVDIINIIPLMATVLKIPNIVRGQENTNNEPVFSTERRISYNIEKPELIEFGRFNQQFEPLFYGSLPTESKNIDYVLSCSLECCKEITQDDSNFTYKDITVGGWKVLEHFPVINLCFDNNHLKENPSLKESVEYYLTEMSSCISSQAFYFLKSFMEYFSTLSGTLYSTPYHYFATTALFNAIRWYYDIKMNDPKFGLIYPGAMSEKKGLNIVLVKEAVDKFLSLQKVVMYRYWRIKGKENEFFALPCSEVVHAENGKFLIKGFVEPN